MNIYLQLIWAYLKIGIFGFGGGYAMLSLVEKAVVGPGWVTETMFTDIVAISQMTPGPIGINSATYIGYVAPGHVNPAYASPMWGVMGSGLATRRQQESGVIKAIFAGLRPVVIGLIASAAILLMNAANFNPNGVTSQLLINIGICAIAFCLVFFKMPFGKKRRPLHPILVITLAGLAGYLIYGL